MKDFKSEICISSVKSTVLSLFGLPETEGNAPADSIVMDEIGKKIDRAVIYNPDAVAYWLYEKYPDKFKGAKAVSDIGISLRSVMPSVTPVCFASMYTGVMPEIHGIQKYTKPVLKTETLFDRMLAEGKKCAIVSTAGDSISKIFLERNMDYYIYPSYKTVNRKALKLIKEDKYDLVVIYNPNYDSFMHATGPEGRPALRALDKNIDFYNKMVNTIKSLDNGHTYFYGFCPDHGCHQIDGKRGSHGLDMEEDMNVIHFYGMSNSSKE